jgi:hypothetical protein
LDASLQGVHPLEIVAFASAFAFAFGFAFGFGF